MTTESPSPAEPEILRYFETGHLHPDLARVSRRFRDLARDTAFLLPAGEQRDMCLWRLLEAKDCAVRATLAGLRRPDPNDEISGLHT